MNFEFSVFSSFQYIVVIILFDAKNVPSLASRTLHLAPGPAFDSFPAFWHNRGGSSWTFPALIRNQLFFQGALVPFSVPSIFPGFPLG